MFDNLKATAAYAELSSNKRLQWLLLLVLALLLLYVLNAVSTLIEDEKTLLTSQIGLHQRLVAAKNTPFDQDKFVQQKNIAQQYLNELPTASSQSAAEASALAALEAALGKKVERNRFNLLGSDLVRLGNTKLWSVRIEINGRLDESGVVNFLDEFTTEKPYRRIASMQYAPKSNNMLVIVIDYLYKEESL
ncbi:hypothetical protein [Brumicola nitratireducens]|uniref:Uncharacterized protein n=1 Tax=Glaciecola nitratireducens (strain JCM 12485 / KCTC 12276 / FR1064) TaxID=1085623 RepID=G4QIQ0_GLANF|nr:hypothetical protein [Glaciecola nitratireducens]AEP31205.1 hypothetical protein GNIT_3110 [Glaciecola nitratireducens FR1064]